MRTTADEPIPVKVDDYEATCPRCGFSVYVANHAEAEQWYTLHLQGEVHHKRTHPLRRRP